MGVLFLSKVLFSFTYAEILGFSLEGRSKFSLISSCSKRRYQFFMGNYKSVEQIPAMKWSLNLLIGNYFALRICIPRSARCKSMSLAMRSFWKAGEPSFCSIIYSGLIPLVIS